MFNLEVAPLGYTAKLTDYSWMDIRKFVGEKGFWAIEIEIGALGYVPLTRKIRRCSLEVLKSNQLVGKSGKEQRCEPQAHIKSPGHSHLLSGVGLRDFAADSPCF